MDVPSGLETLGGGQGVPNSPVGLLAPWPKCEPFALCSAAAGLCGEPKAEAGRTRLWYRTQAMWYTGSSPQSSAQLPRAAQQKSDPKALQREHENCGRLLWPRRAGLLETVSQDEPPTQGPFRTRQGRAEQEGSTPSTPKGIMHVSQSEKGGSGAQNPRKG